MQRSQEFAIFHSNKTEQLNNSVDPVKSRNINESESGRRGNSGTRVFINFRGQKYSVRLSGAANTESV